MAVNLEQIHTIDLESNLDLENFIISIKHKVNNKFIALLKEHPASCNILQEALEYTVLGEGKRLRPALLFSVCEAIINNKPAANPVIKDYLINSDIDNLLLHSAVALELVHTYSLVHDDLPCMDDDDMRRNRPSCHKQFDEATALLVGDALQTMAFELLSLSISSDPSILSKQLKIINLLSQAIGHQGMVGGQSLEFNHSYAKSVESSQTGISLNTFLADQMSLLNTIHTLKTGKLITGALQIGAIIADCEPEQFAQITKLGENLGLIYQIKDDISDYNQDLISPDGLDADSVLLNSSNYVYILGLNKTNAILSEKISESIKILTSLNATDSLLAELIIAIYQNEN